MYMNLENFEVYNYILEPEFKGPAVEVDEMILPAIVTLNKKGYTTQFCCSGHIMRKRTKTELKRLRNLGFGSLVNETYIMLKLTEEGFNNLKKNIPEGFIIEADENCALDSIYPVIRKYITNKTDPFKILDEVYANCKALYMMAKKLPNIKKER